MKDDIKLLNNLTKDYNALKTFKVNIEVKLRFDYKEIYKHGVSNFDQCQQFQKV